MVKPPLTVNRIAHRSGPCQAQIHLTLISPAAWGQHAAAERSITLDYNVLLVAGDEFESSLATGAIAASLQSRAGAVQLAVEGARLVGQRTYSFETQRQQYDTSQASQARLPEIDGCGVSEAAIRPEKQARYV